ncbi:MAG TPA: DUF6768 family protein [Erythrobacter sp.]|nr:DUF6768 family protein [Erythrobacter sp.]
MTDEIDRMIDEALDAEERDLLRRIGEEPGYISQAMGAFTGRLGWVNVVLMVTQAVMFLAGVYAGWMFFAATNSLVAIKWGLPAVALVLLAAMLKMSIWPTIQTNRVLRELKRVELQIARSSGKS